MNPPTIASFLPDLMEFIDRMAQEVGSGRVDSWEKFSRVARQFYTPEVMERMEAVIPGWTRMASFADGNTLVHVTSALVALKQAPEYRQAAAADQALFEWIVLLHDLGKEISRGARDFCHAFRSAATAARILPGLGFAVSAEFADNVDNWITDTRLSVRRDAYGRTLIQDNRRLPDILEGIDRLFGRNTSSAWVIKAILLHASIDVVSDWPQAAPLSEEEILRYLDRDFLPYLEIIMLTDNDAWSLFDTEVKEKQKKETRQVFAHVRELIV